MRWRFRRSVSCTEVLVVLQSYLDGEIDATVARRLVGHLDGCAHCDHERQLYADIKRALGRRRSSVDPEVMTALANYGQRLARGEMS